MEAVAEAETPCEDLGAERAPLSVAEADVVDLRWVSKGGTGGGGGGAGGRRTR